MTSQIAHEKNKAKTKRTFGFFENKYKIGITDIQNFCLMKESILGLIFFFLSHDDVLQLFFLL